MVSLTASLDICLLFLFGILMLISGGFIRFVRRAHPDIWRNEMGSVTMFSNNTAATSLQTLRYILSLRWRSVPDRKFVLFCQFFFLVDILSLGWFGYLVI